MSEKAVTLLVVDDADSDVEILRALLEDVSATVRLLHCSTLPEALEVLGRETVDLTLLDDRIPPVESALESLPAIQGAGYQGPVVVLSGVLDDRLTPMLAHAGAAEWLEKDDLTVEELARLIRTYAG